MTHISFTSCMLKLRLSYSRLIYLSGRAVPRQTFSYSSAQTDITLKQQKTIDNLVSDIRIESPTFAANDDSRIRQRIALSKAITLVESKSPTRRRMADNLLDILRKSQTERINTDCKRAFSSFRLGIAGPPGVGKSTFVDSFGQYLLSLKDDDLKTPEDKTFIPDKLAVLCIDPSSHVTGGSILGDKTRMSKLSYHPRAYVRPSPSSGTLGGLGAYTFDALSLCELAGFGLTIVETVGVGQSEVELAECCDLFLLLLAPGGGDELQGSKKGIVEVADVLVVNKADGDLEDTARKTASEYKKAMSLLRKPFGWWGSQEDKLESQTKSKQHVAPPVLLASAKNGNGMREIFETIVSYRKYAENSGSLREKRQKQNRYWMWKYLRERLLETTQQDTQVRKKAIEVERDLDMGLIAPRNAAGMLWTSIVGGIKKSDK